MKHLDVIQAVIVNVPATALAGIETHQIKLASKDQNTLAIQQVEMSLRSR